MEIVYGFRKKKQIQGCACGAPLYFPIICQPSIIPHNRPHLSHRRGAKEPRTAGESHRSEYLCRIGVLEADECGFGQGAEGRGFIAGRAGTGCSDDIAVGV